MNISHGNSMGYPRDEFENASYVYCGDVFSNCPSNLTSIYYMRNQNSHGSQLNSYDSSWMHHPNFSWSNQRAYMKRNDVAFRKLENQVGQMVNELRSRPQGTILSDIENPINVVKNTAKLLL
ncbi:hypothetical protein EPI10_031386 [Gossypium australe]|uniref:Uncharacterized protein n=1 Tax=Gossypium australe TaxID=47621 RepID=A0A5B6X071_9ROSI|nr:hypothetical protein EPI10_031386 [Gossypium australe]